jgi:dethiobiotin synthetase
MTDDGLRNSDALALQRNSVLPLRYEQVNPIPLQNLRLRISSAPTSSGLLRLTSCLPVYVRWKRKRIGCWLRAGGWFTPLSDTDAGRLGQMEQLPVILVVGVKLGCISHAVLTAQAVQQAGLRLAGWIANDVTPPGRRREYLSTLQRMIPAPMLGEIPWLGEAVDSPLLSNTST